jgi:hypothetical protein
MYALCSKRTNVTGRKRRSRQRSLLSYSKSDFEGLTMNAQTNRTFVLTEPLDLFFKLEWEYDELRRFNITENRIEKSYVALNAAVTAWHLTDWFCARMEQEHFKKLSAATGRHIDNNTVFRNFVKEDKTISMCEQIAVSVKHLQIDERDHKVQTNPRSYLLADGQSAYYLMVEDHNAMMPIDSVIGFALAFWRSIFELTGMATREQVEYPARPTT